jgi:hypothetical protein
MRNMNVKRKTALIDALAARIKKGITQLVNLGGGTKMSADGELYVNERCRDTFATELDEWFGKDNWMLDVSNYMDIWDLRTLGDTMRVIVKDDETGDKILGEVEITNRFFIEDGMEGKYIEVEPESIKLISKA